MEDHTQSPNDGETFRASGKTHGYAALYDFVADRATRTGQNLILPKQAFLAATTQHPNCVDGNLLPNDTDEIFLYSLFWSLFSRVPDGTARDAWMRLSRRKPGLPFRKKLSRRLAASLEAKTKGVMYLPDAPRSVSTRINISEAVRDAMPPFAYFVFLIHDRILDPGIGMLYLLYSRTLRPFRIRIRDRVRKNKTGGDR